MANEEHLEILKQGVGVWNKWKEENPDIKIDLKGANLKYAIFRYANLNGANLSKATLRGVIINEKTNYSKIKECQIGVNGFYYKDTDSAALMTMTPPGNSMKGHNPEAVIENLKRSRRLHGQSLILVAIGIILKIPYIAEKLKVLEIPYFKGVFTIPSEIFVLLAISRTVLILTLARIFFANALSGARYLQDRAAAMQVGNFPWVLSNYAGEGIVQKIQSFFIRFVLAFRPLCYLLFWKEIKIFSIPLLIYFIIISSIILVYCV